MVAYALSRLESQSLERRNHAVSSRPTRSPGSLARHALAALAAALLTGGFALRAVAAGEEVNVYSSRSHYGSEQVFEQFTKKTGIAVNIFGGNNNEVFERLRAEGP